MPKSASRTAPVPSNSTFAGFTSRWTIPASCAAASAPAICAPIRALSSGVSAPRAIAFAQRLPRVVRHGDEQPTVVVLADVVHRRDVRVIEPRRRARLREEARTRVRGLARRVVQELDRDRPVELEIARQIHLAHGTGGERALEPVAPRDQRRARAGIARGPIPQDGEKVRAPISDREERRDLTRHCRVARLAA